MRNLILIIALLVTTTADAQLFRRARPVQRVAKPGQYSHCGNRNCTMCNRNYGYLTAQPRSVSRGQAVTTSAAPSYTPGTITESGTRVGHPDEIPGTQQDGIEAFLQIMPVVLGRAPVPGDCVVDIGAGDGRVPIAARKRYGCRGIGVEIDRGRYDLAVRSVKDAGLSWSDVSMLYGDGTKLGHVYEGAAIVYCYHWPQLLEELLPVLPRGPPCVSYLHPWPGQPQVLLKQDGHKFYVLQKQ